ncbi:NAD(P)-dependent oxidoreductase [Paenibacillus sp. OAS669]|uniref:NAD(P)-dependent oxidoreductase n=1 Tax=Paenibacillus sp. OAS669 TaxID=2663821 RepID=UPI00178938B5|nr:NAD(P)-binding domain-containing protein [Paenibacillus sp. OAS669]MBE1442642.1 3-hydroxyisobutyrate dehydrogenase-like beta-hydroxyacid dehydrogenase [Paenibacillus sp. OAS669]
MSQINPNTQLLSKENESINRQPVTVIGLGMLGSVMAKAFLNHGHPTTVWNRSANKTDVLVARGAVQAASISQAISANPLVIVCVSDYEGVREILDAGGDALSGRVVVNISSGTPELARQMSEWVTSRGADYLDGAAMSGTRLVGQPEAVFLYSGSPASFESHRSTLASLGGATHLGTDPGLASLYDTALFSLIWGTLSGFYHAVALVGTEKVDASAFSSVATEYLPFVSGLMTNHAGQIEKGHYPGEDGTVEIHLAAMEHLLHTSQANGIRTNIPQFFKTLLEGALTAGHGENGVASVIEMIKHSASKSAQ